MITDRRGSLRLCRGFRDDPLHSKAVQRLTMHGHAEGRRGFLQVLTHTHARAHARATSRNPQQPPAATAIAGATGFGCAACVSRGCIDGGTRGGRLDARLGQARRVRHRWCHQPAPASKIIAEGVVALQEACEHAAQARAQRIQRGLEAHPSHHRLTAKSLFHGSFLGRCVAGGRTPSIALPTALKKGERPR